jgi:hypothetical protein
VESGSIWNLNARTLQRGKKKWCTVVGYNCGKGDIFERREEWRKERDKKLVPQKP